MDKENITPEFDFTEKERVNLIRSFETLLKHGINSISAEERYELFCVLRFLSENYNVLPDEDINDCDETGIVRNVHRDTIFNALLPDAELLYDAVTDDPTDVSCTKNSNYENDSLSLSERSAEIEMQNCCRLWNNARSMYFCQTNLRLDFLSCIRELFINDYFIIATSNRSFFIAEKALKYGEAIRFVLPIIDNHELIFNAIKYYKFEGENIDSRKAVLVMPYSNLFPIREGKIIFE